MKILVYLVLGLIAAGFVELFNLADLYQKRKVILEQKRISKKENKKNRNWKNFYNILVNK